MSEVPTDCRRGSPGWNYESYQRSTCSRAVLKNYLTALLLRIYRTYIFRCTRAIIRVGTITFIASKLTYSQHAYFRSEENLKTSPYLVRMGM